MLSMLCWNSLSRFRFTDLLKIRRGFIRSYTSANTCNRTTELECTILNQAHIKEGLIGEKDILSQEMLSSIEKIGGFYK